MSERQQGGQRLGGKVAIVTGGGAGLGASISELYAEQGAKVIIADLNPDDGAATAARIRAAGGSAIFVRTDVTDSDSVRGAVEAAEDEFGGLHIMTANAGVMGRTGSYKSIVDIVSSDATDIFAVNFYGVLHAFIHAAPAIRRSGGGAMTATTSIAAHVGRHDLALYASSKAAVMALVKSVSVDLAPDVRVNAVSPGPTATAMVDDASDEVAAQALQSHPYLAQPREVSHVHLFLASDDASNVNGQIIVSDGGRLTAKAW